MTLSTGRAFTLCFATLLILLVGAAYSNSFTIGFVFDDSYGISDNPSIRSLRNIPRYFSDPFTLTTVRENVDVRPILQVTYALNYAISGLAPWSYHLFNLLFHLAAALFVFLIVRDHLWLPVEERGPNGRGRWVAAAAALFFALAPLNSQSVDYMWARSALLATALYLGAFLASRQRRWATMALLYTLALLTKAIAVTLPAVILLHEWLYRDRERQPTLRAWLTGWRRLIVPVGVPLLLAALYVGYRALVLPPWAESTRHQMGVGRWTWLTSQWSAELYYVRLFLWPSTLSVDHDFPYASSFWQFRAWGALLAILCWLGLALRPGPRRPLYLFATFWFFVTLAPESTLSPLAEVINDHRPYIASSLGLALLLAALLDRGAGLLGKSRALPAFVGVTLVLALAAIPVTRHRNWQWQSSERLWLDAAAKGPGNGRALMNAGLALMGRGELKGARAFFERSRALLTRYPLIYMNLSVLESTEGHLEESLRHAEEAVRLGSHLALSHFYHGAILEKLGRRGEAALAYQRALAINPEHRGAREGLARASHSASPTETEMARGLEALYQRRQPAEAAQRFREALALKPDHYGAHYQLAVALEQLGRSDEARRLWRRTLEMAEGYGDRQTTDAARAHLAKLGEAAPPGTPALHAPQP